MKILLVAPLFPPDTGVPTFRMRFFKDSLSNEHEVDILKLGDENNFSGSIKLIDRRLFTSFTRAILNRGKISKLVRGLLSNYDLVIISSPPYSLYEIAYSAKQTGVPYILDLRDLPDLIKSEQKGTKPQMWLNIKLWLTNKYIQTAARNSEALLCVGTISTALMQQKLKDTTCRVINLHNGFENKDVERVKNYTQAQALERDKSELVIGCIGNIFRFRDTPNLREVLACLNRRKERVTLRHWGKINPELLTYIQGLSNICYVACKKLPRDVLLNELHSVDGFLLACASDLIWEPTTSVFDYILFDKPVIFTGLRNNEAYSILQNSNTRILESEDLTGFDFKTYRTQRRNYDHLQCYSRQFYLDRLLSVIRKLELRKLHNHDY